MGNKKSYLEKWYGLKVYTFGSNQLVQNGSSAWNEVAQEKVFRNNRNWLRSEPWKALECKVQSDERGRALAKETGEARDFYRKPGRYVRAAGVESVCRSQQPTCLMLLRDWESWRQRCVSWIWPVEVTSDLDKSSFSGLWGWKLTEVNWQEKERGESADSMSKTLTERCKTLARSGVKG